MRIKPPIGPASVFITAPSRLLLAIPLHIPVHMLAHARSEERKKKIKLRLSGEPELPLRLRFPPHSSTTAARVGLISTSPRFDRPDRPPKKTTPHITTTNPLHNSRCSFCSLYRPPLSPKAADLLLAAARNPPLATKNPKQTESSSVRKENPRIKGRKEYCNVEQSPMRASISGGGRLSQNLGTRSDRILYVAHLRVAETLAANRDLFGGVESPAVVFSERLLVTVMCPLI